MKKKLIIKLKLYYKGIDLITISFTNFLLAKHTYHKLTNLNIYIEIIINKRIIKLKDCDTVMNYCDSKQVYRYLQHNHLKRGK